MDHTLIATNNDDVFQGERQRMASFRLGKGQPTTKTPQTTSHGTRNNSIVSSSSLSISTSADSIMTSSARHSKRSSHHRRQSSVSTRCESAEVMGVSLPALPTSLSESDNYSLGEKDSIRRRALFALEGRADMGSFSKVEIPDFDSPKRPFELPKPSFTSGTGSPFGLGLSGKRDSFGKALRPSSTLKDQLHTLVEEDEEHAEESMEEAAPTPVAEVAASGATRPRPTSLTLRPLTLAGGLPTPASTPSPAPAPRRPNLNIHIDSPTPAVIEEIKPKRLSSISYKSSVDTPPSVSVHGFGFGLPTPEMTPTSDRRYSGISDKSDRPLSISEQQFLHKSHNALLARIEDLERALTSSRSDRALSRPVSYASDFSARSALTSNLTDSTDEMIQLVTDLKSERDELRLQLESDGDGWRTRVAGLEKQVGVLAKRVDTERREAWVARERAGLLQVEKDALTKALEEQRVAVQRISDKYEGMKTERDAAHKEVEQLRGEITAARKAEDEVTALRAALEEERRKREQCERELESAGLLATPTPRAFQFPVKGRSRGLGFQSMDSETETDVESDIPSWGLKLRSVEEEDESHGFSDEDLNDISRYDDESDADSSVGSLDERVATPCAAPVQSQSGALSKAWTFPRGARPVVAKREQEVDVFFGCLEDMDGSPQPVNMFSFGASTDDDDELPPFVLPADVGVPVPQLLEVIVDPAEEELQGEFLEGGIQFTFTAPTAPSTPEPTETLFPVDVSPVSATPFPTPTDTSFPYALPATPAKTTRVSISTPSKRAGPSFIPQARSAKSTPTKTSIPQRKSPARAQVSSPVKNAVFSPRATATTSTPPPLSRAPDAETSPSPRYEAPCEARGPAALLGPARAAACAPDTTPPMIPRLSLQTFTTLTSYIPALPWSPRMGAAEDAAAGTGTGAAAFSTYTPIPPTPGAAQAASGAPFVRSAPNVPSYVAKNRQLEKLRIRMEEERMRRGRDLGLECHCCNNQTIRL